MHTRWIILIVLFYARMIMALQFQSVAALSPFLMDSLAITLTEIGLLIGLYLGPGVIVAIAGGAVATWFGDKRVVLSSLMLMVLGGIIVGSATSLGWAMVGRVISGAGGVVVNVLMTKLVLDWFAGRNVSTALAIFISSWPIGIALGLLLLPALTQAGGLSLAWHTLTALAVIALAAFWLVYRPPDGAAEAPAAAGLQLRTLPWAPLICAASVWGLYNVAFAMLFGFGSLVLIARGFDVAAASSATSVYILAATAAIPLGGWLADRSGKATMLITTSLVVGIAIFPILLTVPDGWIVPALLIGGLLVGLAPGPVVALPGQILPPEARALGTGVFYAIYYMQMMVAPAIAGWLADRTADVNVTFVFASAIMGIALLAQLGFLRFTRPPLA